MSNNHVSQWLNAYHDGELRGYRARQVEGHLLRCASCRAELESLQTLSALLAEAPPAQDLLPAEQFAAQVGLQLPRRPAMISRQRALTIGWYAIPVILFLAWAFLQTVYIMTGVVIVGMETGWLTGLPQNWQPLPGTINLNATIMFTFVIPFIIGILYMSWLAGWWVSQKVAEG